VHLAHMGFLTIIALYKSVYLLAYLLTRRDPPERKPVAIV